MRCRVGDSVEGQTTLGIPGICFEGGYCFPGLPDTFPVRPCVLPGHAGELVTLGSYGTATLSPQAAHLPVHSLPALLLQSHLSCLQEKGLPHLPVITGYAKCVCCTYVTVQYIKCICLQLELCCILWSSVFKQ